MKSYIDDKPARTKRHERQRQRAKLNNRFVKSNEPTRSPDARKVHKGLSCEVLFTPTKGRGNIDAIRVRVAESLAKFDLEDVRAHGGSIA